MKVLIVLAVVGLVLIIWLRMNRDRWKPEE
jgi:hypothetical protein